MAFQTWFVLCLTYFSAYFLQAQGYYGDCPSNGWDGKPGFSCPSSSYGLDVYCCDEGDWDQRCCTYDDYYNVYYLSTGAIIGMAVGSLVFVGVVIASIVACCVCCCKAAATPASRPVTMHTFNGPQQPGVIVGQQPGVVMGQQSAPPYYYPPPGQPQYIGQAQAQFQSTQPQPAPVHLPAAPAQENQAFEKDPYPIEAN